MEFERELLKQREEIEKAREHVKAAPLESTQLKSSGAATLPRLSNTKLKGKVKTGYLLGKIKVRNKLLKPGKAYKIRVLKGAPRKAREERHRGIALHR